MSKSKLSVLLTNCGLDSGEITHCAVVVSWNHLEEGKTADIVLPNLCESEYRETALALIRYNSTLIDCVLGILNHVEGTKSRAVRELHEISYHKWPAIFQRIRVLALENFCESHQDYHLELNVHPNAVELAGILYTSRCSPLLVSLDSTVNLKSQIRKLKVIQLGGWSLLKTFAYLAVSLFQIRWLRTPQTRPKMLIGYVEDPAVFSQHAPTRFWGPLPKVLSELSIPTTLVSLGRSHFPFTMRRGDRQKIQDSRTGGLQDRISERALEVVGLHEFMTPRVIFAGLHELYKILTDMYWLIRRMRYDVPPIVLQEWHRVASSVLGPTRVRCAMFGCLFSRLFRRSQSQVSQVVFLCEGQDWEVELLLTVDQTLSSRQQQVDVVGFLHLPLKNWDLRSCAPSFSAEYLRLVTCTIQDAEFLTALQAGPSIFPAEPLRFVSSISNAKDDQGIEEHNVVFVTDAISANDSAQSFLQFRATLQKLLPTLKLSLRWHPNLRVPRDFPALENVTKFDRVTDLTAKTIVVCSNDTSALEYLLTGADVIRLVQPRDLSIGQHYLKTAVATTPSQAADMVQKIIDSGSRLSVSKQATRNCLLYGSDLEKWRRIVETH